MKSMSTSQVAQTNEEILSSFVLTQATSEDFKKDQSSCKKSFLVGDSEDKSIKPDKINVILSPDIEAAPGADEIVNVTVTNAKPSQEDQEENKTEDIEDVVKNEESSENQAKNMSTTVEDRKSSESQTEGNGTMIRNKESIENLTEDSVAKKSEDQLEDTLTLVKTEESTISHVENTWALDESGSITAEEYKRKKDEAKAKARKENNKYDSLDSPESADENDTLWYKNRQQKKKEEMKSKRAMSYLNRTSNDSQRRK